MPEMHSYTIKNNRLKNSCHNGFTVNGDTICCVEEDMHHVLILGALDGIEEGALWGRFCFETEWENEVVHTVYAYATDQKEFVLNNQNVKIEDFLWSQEETTVRKKAFFENAGASKAVNQKDILLYEQNGRYLYLMLDVIGKGQGTIHEMRVYNSCDIFMETFPEVYQEYGSFFHRYLSVFSSMYLDFHDQVDHIGHLFDLSQTPVELLPVFGKWLGIDVSGDFLEEERLRRLIVEAYQLNKRKGTKAALEQLTEIVLGEKAIILERNIIRGDDTQIEKNLYGSGLYDVTMLIKTYVPEKQKSQLLFLINQFKPVRSRLFIRFLDERGDIDCHTYLDMNAVVSELKAGTLDSRQQVDGMILLKE